jgi:hypothetical protein
MYWMISRGHPTMGGGRMAEKFLLSKSKMLGNGIGTVGPGHSLLRSFAFCVHYQMLFTFSNYRGWDRRGMQHVWGREEVHTRFRWKNVRIRDHWEDPGLDGRIILIFRHHAFYIYRTGVPLLPEYAFYIFIHQIYLIILLDFLAPSSFITPQNVMYFLMLLFLVHRIFTFYINSVLNCKCPALGPKG